MDTLASGYATAMRICAGVCGLGGLIAWTTIRERATVSPVPHPSLMQSCQHPYSTEAD
jgi:hypothetical protein